MNTDEHILFHSVGEETTPEKGPIAEHFEKHYKKHLFGLGILLGIALFKVLSMIGPSLGMTRTADTTKADYQQTNMEKAVQAFDQIIQVAEQKDSFFHQAGKIYTLTGDTLFHKSDLLFHLLDNAYHKLSGTQEKFEQAQQFNQFLKRQDTLFQATQDVNTDRDTTFHSLENKLSQAQAGIIQK